MFSVINESSERSLGRLTLLRIEFIVHIFNSSDLWLSEKDNL